MKIAWSLILILVLGLAACGSASRVAGGRELRPRCPPPVVPTTSWRHTRSSILAALAPGHSAGDVVAPPGRELAIHGKLAYGPTSKDLEDEDVTLWMEAGDCHATQVARGITGDDGRVSFTLPGRGLGTYQFWVVVSGDGTTAPGTVHVVPRGRRAVVFDVDGTLTTSDRELFEELAGGGAAEMFVDADAVARYWADHDHLVVYVTGRPYPLRAATRRWLELRRFPPGPMLSPDRFRDAVPTEGGIGVYKTAALEDLVAAGLDIVRAYGNASTDVCAYARSGIPPEHTYIVGADARRCDDHLSTLPLRSYTEHLRELGSTPPAR